MVTSNNIRQSGFGGVVALVIVLVFVAISGIGYGVIKHRQDVKKSVAAAVAPPAPAPRADEIGQTQPAQPDSQQPYLLAIKEWGVSVPLPTNIKDAYYTTAGSNTGDDGLANTVWISTTFLNGTSCDVAKTGPTETLNPVGSIIRVLPDEVEPVKSVTYKSLYTNGITIGKYYYAYTVGINAKCASKTTLDAINTSFNAAIKNATPTAATTKQ